MSLTLRCLAIIATSTHVIQTAMQSLPSLRKIQHKNWTVAMDKYRLFSAPMQEFHWLSWHLTKIQKTHAGSNSGWISMSFYTIIQLCKYKHLSFRHIFTKWYHCCYLCHYTCILFYCSYVGCLSVPMSCLWYYLFVNTKSCYILMTVLYISGHDYILYIIMMITNRSHLV